MKTNAKVEKGEIVFSSELAKRLFMERNEGKYLLIEPDETISAEMRRYFEGCIVPVVFYTHPRSGWDTFRDAREALKLEFLPSRQVRTLNGKTVATAVPSTSDLTKEQFRRFLDAITRWLLENELVTENDLDSTHYVAWRDSAPAAGEVYPPLKRMKEWYDAEIKKAHPWKNTPILPLKGTQSQ